MRKIKAPTNAREASQMIDALRDEADHADLAVEQRTNDRRKAVRELDNLLASAAGLPVKPVA